MVEAEGKNYTEEEAVTLAMNAIESCYEEAAQQIQEARQRGEPAPAFWEVYEDLIAQLLPAVQSLITQFTVSLLKMNAWTIIEAPARGQTRYLIWQVNVDPMPRRMTREELKASTITGEDGKPQFDPDATGKAYGLKGTTLEGHEFPPPFMPGKLYYSMIRATRVLIPGSKTAAAVEQADEYFYTKNGAAGNMLAYVDPLHLDKGETFTEEEIVPNPQTGKDEIVQYSYHEIPTYSTETKLYIEAVEDAEIKAAVSPYILTGLDMIQEKILTNQYDPQTGKVHIPRSAFMKETGLKQYETARKREVQFIKFLYRLHYQQGNAATGGAERGMRILTSYDIPKEDEKRSDDYHVYVSPQYIAALKAIPYNLKRPRTLHKFDKKHAVAVRIANDIFIEQRYAATHEDKDGTVHALTLLNRYFPARTDEHKHGDKRFQINPFFKALRDLKEGCVFKEIIFHEGKKTYRLEKAAARYTTAESLNHVRIEGVNFPEHGDYITARRSKAAAAAKRRKKPRRSTKKPTNSGAESTNDGANA
ncbi:hypothetical protein IKD57_01390 [Candidatus Saccharibacteria bacterium]|nr:hypothetical protein [Candidatus Saccharibacteria bacterium]